MRGNLAPGTGITKPIAMDPAMYHFSGPARVFDCEEDANRAILDGNINEGDVLVIRYEGPKGGPGMREMYFAMKLLYGRGLAKKTAIITDGRFSGTNNGCFVGHISPEAAEGGPIHRHKKQEARCRSLPRRTGNPPERMGKAPSERTERHPRHIRKTGRLSSRRRNDEGLAQ